MFVAGMLLMALFGAFTWRMESVRRLDVPARIAVAFAAGMVVGGVVMFAYSVLGVPWRRWTVAIPLIAGAAFFTAGRDAPRTAGGTPAFLVFVLLTAYGVATARETNADLLYFWGTKAQRFWMEERIDTDFLKFPHYSLMHRDYPPLQPLVYAFGAVIAQRFSWWGTLYFTPIVMLATLFVFRGYSRDKWFTILLAAILAYGIAIARSAGGAEPLLYFFEVLALCALTFRNDYAIAAIALTGVVLTKVEGTTFTIVFLIAFLLTRRKILPALAIAAPPALALGAWVLFARQHIGLDSYARGDKILHLAQLGMIVKRSLGSFYLPWLAAIPPLLLGRNWKRAAFPLLVALGTLGSAIFFYLHEADPAFWIKTSAQRVVLTSLLALVVAGAAGSSEEDVC